MDYVRGILDEVGLGGERLMLFHLPGTAAEILDDSVRAVLCPDKLKTQEWLDVVEAAHHVGLTTTTVGCQQGPQPATSTHVP